MQHLFGKIKNQKMILNEAGQIARNFWLEIPKHFYFVEINEWECIIMPNHIHGIVHIIDKAVRNADLHSVRSDLHSVRSDLHSVRYRSKMALPLIIHQYKSSVTREIRIKLDDSKFAWHKSYHDRIIRTERELSNIQQYIINNPLNWDIK